MFDRICRRRTLSAGGLGVPSGVHRHICAWLAILGLYVQLFAAGLCTGAPLDPALGDSAQSAFPICHAPNSSHESAPAQGPAHHACPFCALHCQAAMVVAPTVGAPQRSVAASTQPAQAPFVPLSRARFSAGAPPRGPPASA